MNKNLTKAKTAQSSTMAFNGDVTILLGKIVKFLEELEDAKLSESLEINRKSILLDSKDVLTSLSCSCSGNNTREEASSPEPYLDMRPGKGSLMIQSTIESNEQLSEEYVDAEAKVQEPSYYETFQELKEHSRASVNSAEINIKGEDVESAIIDIYLSLTPNQTRSISAKCGSLELKEGKKLFVFEQFRTYWVGLVGTYLLIYDGDKKSNKPLRVIPIRGYMGRPAPNIIPKDQKRSDFAFEIFSPGSKTLQFIARSAEEMEQWVSKICDLGSLDRAETRVPTIEALMAGHVINESQEEPYQDASSKADVSEMIKPREVMTVVEACREGGPPLPKRIPRKLPSLPRSTLPPTYLTLEDDEDGIYHRIEDIREANKLRMLSSSVARNNELIDKTEMYDDVTADLLFEAREDNNAQKIDLEESKEIDGQVAIILPTYDDVRNVIADNDSTQLPSYDDVQSLSNDLKRVESEEIVEVKKDSKKSFLERMRSRKGSVKKDKKRTTKRSSMPQESLTYDDVANGAGGLPSEEMYNFPPPPRPIYSKPTSNELVVVAEQFNSETEDDAKMRNRESMSQELIECEHYQIPKSNSCRVSQIILEEELYDDVAIIADFTSRHREPTKKLLSVGLDKRMWGRFGSGKRTKSSVSIDSAKSSSDNDDIDHQHSSHDSHIKLNTLQKLISKMESSLGKSSKNSLSVSSA